MKVQNYSVRILNSKNNPAPETGEGYVPLKHGETYSILLRSFSDKDSLALVLVDGKKVACVKVPAKEKVTIDGPFNSDKRFTFYKSGSEEFESSQLEEVDKEDLGLIEVKFIDAGNTETQQTTINGHVYYIPLYYVYYYWWLWWKPLQRPNLDVQIDNFPDYSIGVVPTKDGAFTICPNDNNISTVNSPYSSSSGTVWYSTSSVSSGGTGLSGMANDIPAETEKLAAEFDRMFDHEVSTSIYLRLVAKDDNYQDKPERMVGFSNKKPAPVNYPTTKVVGLTALC